MSETSAPPIHKADIRLEGKKITLAPLGLADCRDLYARQDCWQAMSHPYMFDYNSPIDAADEMHEWLCDEESDEITLGVFSSDGCAVGMMELQNLDFENLSCGIGVVIASGGDRGRGYAREAVGLAIDFAFNRLGMNRICAETLETNLPMLAVLRGLGFALEVTRRRDSYFCGSYVDSLVFGLLRADCGQGAEGF